MINLTIGTNTERKNILVAPNESIAEVLANNNVNTTSAAIHINGSLVPGCDLQQTFEEFGVEDNTSAMLIAVVKADSAR